MSRMIFKIILKPESVGVKDMLLIADKGNISPVEMPQTGIVKKTLFGTFHNATLLYNEWKSETERNDDSYEKHEPSKNCPDRIIGGPVLCSIHLFAD